MTEHFHAGGEANLKESTEYREKMRRLRDSLYERYAGELAKAGFFRRLILRWRIAAEYRRERQKIGPSSQALYSSAIGREKPRKY